MLKTPRQQLFFAHAVIIPTMINPDGQRAGQRCPGIPLGLSGSSSTESVKAGLKRKSSVTEKTKRRQRSCLEGEEGRRENRTQAGKPLALGSGVCPASQPPTLLQDSGGHSGLFD